MHVSQMQKIGTYHWHDPIVSANQLKDEAHLVLLYSGIREYHSGRYSFLAWNISDILSTSRWTDIHPILSVDKQWFENAWFGWLGYEMADNTKIDASLKSPFIEFPRATFMRFHHLLRFDHLEHTVEYFSNVTPDLRWQADSDAQTIIAESASNRLKTGPLMSNISKQAYIDIVNNTKRRIEAGDFYQANITRKFNGAFLHSINYWELFKTLSHVSAASYSCYVRHGNKAILSSSPECFLTIDSYGKMLSRPIKGSAARGKSIEEDNAIKASLEQSTKDLAENRMIVDLVRNDMAKVSVPGSVTVEASAQLHTYHTVHHLISSISAQKSPTITTLEAVRSCFPPGSMTGAPKIAAMHWCSQNELMKRGIYSGALGWMGGDGSCDFSVVIRTILLENNRFEFQVGGAIVADSDPYLEWKETLIKARGIALALGIDERDLSEI